MNQMFIITVNCNENLINFNFYNKLFNGIEKYLSTYFILKEIKFMHNTRYGQ